MTTNANPALEVTSQPEAAIGLALVRVTIGATVPLGLFEKLGKGLYTGGYAGLINCYIKASHSPSAWKVVMGLAASHAAPSSGKCSEFCVSRNALCSLTQLQITAFNLADGRPERRRRAGSFISA